MNNYDCIINCTTLICERCFKPAKSCTVKRNCKKLMQLRESKPVTDISPFGPGSELKKLLSKIGIEANTGCKCSDRARHIDYMESIEPGWTERNIENIIDWMQEEAKKRKLPFVRAGAKVLVKLAIRRAKN
jgi:hypothetical protein